MSCSCAFSFAYSVTFKALIVTIICIIAVIGRYSLFSFFFGIKCNLYLCVLSSKTEESAFCSFFDYFDRSLFLCAAELGKSCLDCFINCFSCFDYCLLHICKASFEPKLILLFLAVLLIGCINIYFAGTCKLSFAGLLEYSILLCLYLSLFHLIRLGKHIVNDNACDDAH